MGRTFGRLPTDQKNSQRHTYVITNMNTWFVHLCPLWMIEPRARDYGRNQKLGRSPRKNVGPEGSGDGAREPLRRKCLKYRNWNCAFQWSFEAVIIISNIFQIISLNFAKIYVTHSFLFNIYFKLSQFYRSWTGLRWTLGGRRFITQTLARTVKFVKCRWTEPIRGWSRGRSTANREPSSWIPVRS